MGGPGEQEGLEAQSPTLCSNNCGYFSNPGCNGMCSMCYRSFSHGQSTKDPVPGTGSPDMKASSSKSDAIHPSSSPKLVGHALRNNSPIPPSSVNDSISSGTQGCRLVCPIPSQGSPVPRTEAENLETHGELEVARAPARPRKLRCSTCRKKVGIIGFNCKCGELFCEQHRCPESHACSFDHKASERLKIQEDNPVVISERVKRV